MGVYFGAGKLFYDGSLIGPTRDTGFIETGEGELRGISYGQTEDLCSTTIAVTFDFEPVADLDLLLEYMFPELGWRSFAEDLDRRLRWLI